MPSSVNGAEATAKPANPRLPSLNQLAARININAPPASSNTSSAPRPRLPAFALRTNSTTSLSSTATTTDSMAVNPPTTRSGSPNSTTSGASAPHTPSNESAVSAASETPVDEQKGEPLTSEKLKELNAEQQDTKTGNPPPKGYKNIPSLDAITQRLANRRHLSVDGTATPPEAEMIEDPKTPGFPMKAPEHQLRYSWTIYHDTKSKYPPTSAAPQSAASAPGSANIDGSFSAHVVPESTDYEAGLTVVGEFDTVEQFCRYFNWLKPPSKLERNSNFHLFKQGIKPMWEDEANANGGKWVLTMKNNPALLDRCWNWLAMALVGQELEEGEDEICGAVVSLRSKVDRIQVWTRSKDDVEKLNKLAKRLVKLLDVSEADGIGLEFQYNSDDRPPQNKFLSIQNLPSTGYRATFNQSKGGDEVASPASAGAFGSFGIGLAGSGWRGQKRG